MEEIFNKIAGKKMKEWDINSFKKSHKKLYDSIIESMFAVEKVTTDLERNQKKGIDYMPITKEYLVSFGFEKESDGFYRNYKNKMVEILIHDDGVLVTSQSVCLNHIKYAHQLQSLYFALIGYEL